MAVEGGGGGGGGGGGIPAADASCCAEAEDDLARPGGRGGGTARLGERWPLLGGCGVNLLGKTGGAWRDDASAEFAGLVGGEGTLLGGGGGIGR